MLREIWLQNLKQKLPTIIISIQIKKQLLIQQIKNDKNSTRYYILLQLLSSFLLSLFNLIIKTISYPQQIQYNQRMINKLTLNDAVSKLYGKSLVPARNPIADWQLFMPYIKQSNADTLLVRLLEVPSYLYTSEQICNQRISKFEGILHEVKFIFIERCFQSSYYLLIAEDNLIPISSVLKIKKQAGEKVDESLIFDYIEFINQLQSHPYSKQIYFDQNDIGINSEGRFILANYLMYFQDQQNQGKKQKKNKDCEQGSLIRDAKNVLAKIVMNSTQNVDWMVLCSHVEEKYGSSMLAVVQKFMEDTTNYSQILSLITEIKRSTIDDSFSATITDTCVEQGEKMAQNLMNQTANTNAIDESFRKIKQHKRLQKTKKTFGLIVLFIIIFIGIGAVTFQYLKPRPLQCDENQYADQSEMKCLNCDQSCQSCSGGGNLMCTSCKPSMFLILHDFHDKVGKCGQVCHGTIIKTSTCIDNH